MAAGGAAVTARRLAWSIWGVSMIGLVAPFGDLQGQAGTNFVALVGYSVFLGAAATVGALVASRRPGNAIGWILAAAGLGYSLAGLAIGYSQYAFEPGHSLPAATAVAWAGNWLWSVVIGLAAAYPLLLFPDGHLPSRRWRPVAWIVPPATALAVLGTMLDPSRLDVGHHRTIANPTALAGGDQLAHALTTIGFFGIIAAFLASAVSVVLRFRRASGVARLQLKWLIYAAGLILFTVFVVGGLISALVGGGDDADNLTNGATSIALASYPVALGVAILRHRLYDIDVVINRTLVYGALTATLAAVYVGSVLLLQLALDSVTSGSSLAVAISTLGVAALFRPARTRIQATVDRRFYRRKYDAARTLEEFSARLREQVDLDALGGELHRVVAETMQPAHVSLWLREAGR
jgi:hypothetical protein